MSLLVILSVIVALGITWVVFEFTIDDPKGEENAVKKIIYQAAAAIPVYPAIELNVPYHHQQHALSCEVASLTMALNFKGSKVTENELISQLPVSDSGPRNLNNNAWGDPNLGFVGNIDGRMPNTGYGVYEQPIYDLAIKYRNAKIISNGTISDLIAELSNGNPVVVWGVIGIGRDISWQTASGKIINAKMNEHARTLIGFTGASDMPKSMILLDPIYGKITMSVNDFQKNWEQLDKRAVAIY